MLSWIAAANEPRHTSIDIDTMTVMSDDLAADISSSNDARDVSQVP